MNIIVASLIDCQSGVFLFFCGLLLSSIAAIHASAAEDAPVVRKEFIFETAAFPSCHASTIAETRQGLVAAWFGGTGEGQPDVGIWLSRQAGGRWTAPQEVAQGIVPGERRYPCWNPVLFQPSRVATASISWSIIRRRGAGRR